MPSLPIIDLTEAPAEVARQIQQAGQAYGFFYLVGHGVDEALARRLEALSHQFFALPEAIKVRFAMARGGRAWRGWFPLGGELTSGRPDWKEGLYLGTELSGDDPRVQAGLPMHGPNLLPDDDLLPGFRATVFAYLDQVTQLGQRVMAAVARSLGLRDDHFAREITADPLILFRIFLYPSRPVPEGVPAEHGVGEHTDYGLITLLRQDDVGGLQVRTSSGWIEAGPLPGAFLCNVGDMLDRMTGGRYRSVPHRVLLNHSGRDRLSMPLFFDPSFDARIVPLAPPAEDDRERRWDRESVHTFQGTYGDYLLTKVGRVFPGLRAEVLADDLGPA
ncbi:MAG: isopenicillin N synthase family oxygenase [Deltaproteobacteria bacterium]|nr:isopenicillin N synthase family oxygenase [Deltaproteobacteria bacterium]